MKYLRDCDPRFQHLGLKVGSFLILLVLILALMIGILGWRQDAFRSTVIYTTEPERADPLHPGMDVTLHGIRIGRVTTVDLNAEGRPIVTLRIRESATGWLHRNARVVLTGVDFLGTPFLNIDPGTAESGPLPPGSILPFEREMSFGEAAVKIEEQLRPVIAATAELMESLNRPDGDVRRSIAELRALSESLGREIPPALVDLRATASSSRRLLDDFLNEESDLQSAQKSLRTTTTEIEQHLPEMLARLEKSLESLRRTTDEIERATTTSSPEMQKLIARSGEAVNKADRLISDVRKIWFMKIFLPRQKPQAED